jgi:nucleoid-associated protein YgaU
MGSDPFLRQIQAAEKRGLTSKMSKNLLEAIMNRSFLMPVIAAMFLFSGCAVRTYEIQQQRLDQDLTSGNRGVVKGEVPMDDIKDRRTTRPIKVLELEMPVLKKLSARSDPQAYLVPQPSQVREAVQAKEEPTITVFEEYKVQQNDTLQKISQKFYNSIHKWSRIYEANRDALKSPDSIYPGQTLKIPISKPAAAARKDENIK